MMYQWTIRSQASKGVLTTAMEKVQRLNGGGFKHLKVCSELKIKSV
jgi:hypothetical protein